MRQTSRRPSYHTEGRLQQEGRSQHWPWQECRLLGWMRNTAMGRTVEKAHWLCVRIQPLRPEQLNAGNKPHEKNRNTSPKDVPKTHAQRLSDRAGVIGGGETKHPLQATCFGYRVCTFEDVLCDADILCTGRERVTMAPVFIAQEGLCFGKRDVHLALRQRRRRSRCESHMRLLWLN
jgi:hypothetical protein